MSELLSSSIRPIDPEALGPEVGGADTEALDAATDFLITIGMPAKRRNQDFRVLGTDLVSHIVVVEHRIQERDGIAFLGEFQFTEIEWLGWQCRFSFFLSLRRQGGGVALCSGQQFLTDFADDDRGNIHSLELLISFRNPSQAGFLRQIVSGDLFVKCDRSHAG